ncbi:MAG: MFS transporter [Alphaproteobacteria bacterium]|nr:MFS transporter [Alphaproteobacteria bacterium]MDE2041920.1 MFS transporter [Alphaproteobacteria bacterium]MDE2340141.1 MFS transporter [Alphaproteobacteria bacterium]
MAGPIAITAGQSGPAKATAYGWLVFALAFGLLISDYMARQVLNVVFPLLKAEWRLTDGQLGLLSGVVAVMVGVLTFPLSLLADRWGRVRSLTLMAILWSLATLFCAMAANYSQMLGGRIMVGLGEAAYGSVGIALVISVFPAHLRATLASAFMAGGLFGQVIGVAIGGQIAASHGWRTAFVVIGLSGLALALIFPMLVRERRNRALIGAPDTAEHAASPPSLKDLFASRSVTLAYIASGLQFFASGALAAWVPAFLNRYHAMPVDRAGRAAALLFLVSGTGMILCGMVCDRLSRGRPDRKIVLAIGYCMASALALTLAMHSGTGLMQLILLGVAMFFVSGTSGPSGAMVANLTPVAIHGTAFATLTLANNLLGLAPGPIVTGRLADAIGLDGAFRLIPLASVAAAIGFAVARRSYLADLARVNREQV